MADCEPTASSPTSIRSDVRISMSEDHFRWLLMWHTAFTREAMMLEIAIHGLDQAKRNTKTLDRQRRAFLAEHWPEHESASNA